MKARVAEFKIGEKNLIIKFINPNAGKSMDWGWGDVTIQKPEVVGFQFVPLDQISSENLTFAEETFKVNSLHEVQVFDSVTIGEAKQNLVKVIM